jgi:hypothetical protein
MVFVKFLGAAALVLFAHALLAQQSQWVHPGADGHLIYGRDKSGAVIPDYSFAGYRSGGVALPDIPAQIKLLPTGADDTATIQHAIDTVSAHRSTPTATAVPYNSPRAYFTAPLRL